MRRGQVVSAAGVRAWLAFAGRGAVGRGAYLRRGLRRGPGVVRAEASKGLTASLGSDGEPRTARDVRRKKNGGSSATEGNGIVDLLFPQPLTSGSHKGIASHAELLRLRAVYADGGEVFRLASGSTDGTSACSGAA